MFAAQGELGDGAWIAYADAWMASEQADALQAALTEQVAWEAREIVVFGKRVMQPRLVGWAGELPYRYSGQTLEPREAPPALAALWQAVEAATELRFNHVMLNRYRNGADHMSTHADDEPALGHSPQIASISLGARRPFEFTRKKRKYQKRTIRLGHGSLLLMGGTIQHTWYHGVPKQAAIEEERINLTFRWLCGPPGWRPPKRELPDRSSVVPVLPEQP